MRAQSDGAGLGTLLRSSEYATLGGRLGDMLGRIHGAIPGDQLGQSKNASLGERLGNMLGRIAGAHGSHSSPVGPELEG